AGEVQPKRERHPINFKKKSEKIDNRVESALTEPTLSHHGTCDVAYRGFKLAFNKTKNFALLGLGCHSMPERCIAPRTQQV
ncbi:MAG: hypothetical protein GY821_08105, partial [Gammaproteobacteria bacterium]|nr:hypothetical protein [Gammaproteobacteria bacterium]